jgi:hypothetical protein
VPAPSFYPSFYRVEHWGLLLSVAAFAKIFPLVLPVFSCGERERERVCVCVWARAGWEGLEGGERGRECSRGIDGSFGSLFVFWLFVVKAERGTKCAVCLSFSSLSLYLSPIRFPLFCLSAGDVWDGFCRSLFLAGEIFLSCASDSALVFAPVSWFLLVSLLRRKSSSSNVFLVFVRFFLPLVV